jgi:hypothetical protein
MQVLSQRLHYYWYGVNPTCPSSISTCTVHLILHSLNMLFIFIGVLKLQADPSGRAFSGVGLRPLVWWDCGFESRWRHGCLPPVSVVCYQVEVSASGWSHVQRRFIQCGASECSREADLEVSSIAGLDDLEKRRICMPCWTSNYDCSVV